jgi:hypothetical protein
VIVPPGFTGGTVATCSAGKVVGGGVRSDISVMPVEDSYPSGPTTWQVNVRNTGTDAANVFAEAICMTTEPSTVIAKVGKGAKKKAR